MIYQPPQPPQPTGKHKVKQRTGARDAQGNKTLPILPPQKPPESVPTPPPQPTGTPPPKPLPPVPPAPSASPMSASNKFRQNVQAGMKGQKQGGANFYQNRQSSMNQAKGLLSGAIPSRIQKRMDRVNKRVSNMAAPANPPSNS